MGKIFIALYDFFGRRRALFWTVLWGSVAVMAVFAAGIRLDENISAFFPDDAGGRRYARAFDNLKVKDKIVVMVSDTSSPADPDRMIEAVDRFTDLMQSAVDDGAVASIMSTADAETVGRVTDFLYGHLPVFLSEEDYARLDSLTDPAAVGRAVERAYAAVTSPLGMAMQETVLRDPLGLGTPLLQGLRDFDTFGGYEIYGDHIFSADFSTALIVVEPAYGTVRSADNEALTDRLESAAAQVRAESGVEVSYFGGPVVAVQNARQIKNDTVVTVCIALLIIIAVILFSFRNRWSAVLIIVPVIYGILFALALVSLLRGSISSVAVGAGAAVFGIALSYSIHVLSHSNHTADPRRVIRELAYPLSVGSFTTIGAFLGLIFTKSAMLRDFGLFSALALVGTTLFCLIFLPHFLPRGEGRNRPSRMLRFIERINAYPFDRNRPLVGALCGLTVLCLFFYSKVRFDSDMNNLCYMPRETAAAQHKLESLFGRDDDQAVYVSVGAADVECAYRSYGRLDGRLDSLRRSGDITGYVTAARYAASPALQRSRAARWEQYWTPQKRRAVAEAIDSSAAACGFRAGAFAPFHALLGRPAAATDYACGGSAGVPLLHDWINVSDSTVQLVARIAIDPQRKDSVYPLLESDPNVTVIDRSYLTSQIANAVNDDFYTILYISSLLIFGALLLSYGRIELALLASVPMLVSWVIILGLMALLGIDFNIVNIILATFIFGTGDDFSIFIMDGLLGEYKDGRRLLPAHKTAIFFSAFTTVVGIGALIFSAHPALRSISLISILGMVAVVLVAYTIQPILFRWFVTSQTRKGGFPYTLLGLLNTAYAFIYFVLGCGLLQGLMATLFFAPISRKRKKLIFHRAVRGATRIFLATMFTAKTLRRNPSGENFERPAVVIANHQSFIDILLLLSIHPKLVMVTNRWVWRSPFFGRIVRYAGFYHTADGYDSLAENLSRRVAEGYSVVVFPEGTRSADCRVGRFHKGAFYLAELLKLDIVPTLIYGAGLVSSKRQGFYIKKGYVVGEILPRIRRDDLSYGATYQERARTIGKYFREQYERLCGEFDRPCNPYFYDALVKNYIYKGPELEWYMRIKVRMERSYRLLDELIPRRARIVDVGCGYGQAAYMLGLLSAGREVLGIDYDEEKIALARHCFSHREGIRFVSADAADYPMPPSDAFVINDALHYLPPHRQTILLEHCVQALAPGGVLIVREGDASQSERHRCTRRTERWSTRIVKFNKSLGELWYITAGQMEDFAARRGLALEIRPPEGRSSNTHFIFRKKSSGHE